MNNNDTNYFKKYAQPLIRNGFRIIPIPPGEKYPTGFHDWRNKDFHPIYRQLSNHPKEASGVGVKCGEGLVCVDVDSTDEDISSDIIRFCFDRFGDSPVRYGKAPKAALFYRVLHGQKKVKSKMFHDDFGGKHELELLADGQQAVVYAVHPETNEPYKWEGGELAETQFDDLVVIDEDDIKALVEKFESLCEQRGFDGSGKTPSSLPATDGSVLERVKPRRGLSNKEIFKKVKLLDPSMGHDDWVRVGMAIYHETDGSPTGFKIWDRWSQGAPDKYSREVIELKWPTFRANVVTTNPVTWGTIQSMINELTLTPTADPNSDTEFFIDLGEYSKNTPAIDWLITDYIEDLTTGVLFGEPGSYKSFLSIDIALHVATGQPWHGQPVKQGPALLIEGEGRQGVGKRARVWSDHYGQDLTGKAFISTTSASLMDADGAIELMNHIKRLRRSIKQNPRVIVIDTLARNFGNGDENATVDMNQFVKHVDAIRDEFKCTVLIVHHTGRSSKEQPRGNSALVGACDFMYRTETQASLMAKLVCVKMKDAEQPQPTYFKGSELTFETNDGGENTSLYFEKADGVLQERKELKGKQLELYQLLLGHVDDAGVCDREKLTAMALDLEIYSSKASARSAIRRLKDAGWVSTDEKGIKDIGEVIQ